MNHCVFVNKEWDVYIYRGRESPVAIHGTAAKKKSCEAKKAVFLPATIIKDTSVKLLTPQMANKVSYDTFYD